MTWVISRILPYTLATCIHSGLRMHTPGGEEGTYAGAFLHRVPTLLPPQCSFCGWSPKSIQSLPAQLSQPYSIYTTLKKLPGFFFPKKAFKNHLSPAGPCWTYPTARGFSGPQWLQDHLQPRLVPWQQRRKHPGKNTWQTPLEKKNNHNKKPSIYNKEVIQFWTTFIYMKTAPLQYLHPGPARPLLALPRMIAAFWWPQVPSMYGICIPIFVWIWQCSCDLSADQVTLGSTGFFTTLFLLAQSTKPTPETHAQLLLN